MDVEIRAARPEDVEDAIPLIYSSGPACFDYVFSHRTRIDALEYLRQAFRRPGGEFGYANHHVAVLDGAVVGTGAGYGGQTSVAFMWAALRQIFSSYGPLHAVGVCRRGLQVERIVRPPQGDLHYVAHIGVAPEFRSRGIGAQLVSFLLDKAREDGRAVSALDVSVENPRAQALYERLGFTVTREIKSSYENATARVPDHRRMETRLQ